ncbi:hypothetical protein EK21DRAFT_111338 [Setomelanomma holmii]|uniref:Uncharacterized protein n=1 Tax=Setomelanomma holmii TaxID=210430 RepID=A0A9P4LNV7_9PLEO|nr:hypothetical protein EK21DRAFT_111338 [Setomelanomma holmii]
MAVLLVFLNLVPSTHALPLAGLQSSTQNTTNLPVWLDSATFFLLCYEVLSAVIFCWLGVRAYSAWKQRQSSGQQGNRIEMRDMSARRARREVRGQSAIEGRMRRMGMI